MPPTEKAPPRNGARQDTRVAAYAVTAPLRFLLHQVEAKLGLFPPETGLDGHGRFHAAALLEVNSELPSAMASVFEEELAGLGRIGKKTGGCHGSSLPPLKLFCVAYYYFDGFNALLFAEKGGNFFAAWKEQEMHAERSPETILAPGPFDEFQTVFSQVLSLPS